MITAKTYSADETSNMHRKITKSAVVPPNGRRSWTLSMIRLDMEGPMSLLVLMHNSRFKIILIPTAYALALHLGAGKYFVIAISLRMW